MNWSSLSEGVLERPVPPAFPALEAIAAPATGRLRSRLPTLLLWGSFAVAVCLYFASMPDDTLITMRYAHNLLAGLGPVFNPGQRVNGATSPVGLGLAVVALLLPGGFALLKLKLLSLLFGALTVRKGGQLLRLVGFRGAALGVASVAVGASAPLAYASATGLETTVAAFAVAGLLVSFLGQSRRGAASAGWAVLAVLCRPEAIVVVLAVGVVGTLASRRKAIWMAGPLVAELAVVAGNLLYYGSALPNTYYAKSIGPSHAWAPGLIYVLRSLDPGFLIPDGLWGAVGRVFLITTDIFLVFGLVQACRSWRRLGPVAVAVIAQCGFAVSSGGDWMPGGRFLAPVCVPIVVLFVSGANDRASAMRRAGLPRVMVAVPLASVVMFSGVALTQPSTVAPITSLFSGVSDESLVANGHYGSLSKLWAAAPRLLACARPGELVATTEAGLGPYVDSSLRVLDLRGLTSAVVARRATSAIKNNAGVQDWDWADPTSPVGQIVLQQRPVLILTTDPPRQATILGGRYHPIASSAGGTVYVVNGYSCAGTTALATR